MTDLMLLHEARMLIRDFVQLRRGELVAIYTDAGRISEAEALRLAAIEAGGDVLVLDIGHQVANLLTSGEFFIAPPDHMLGVMEKANVSIFAVDETYAFRLDHRVNEFFDVGEHRQFFAIDPGMGSWGLSSDDVNRVQKLCTSILEAMKGADRVRITTRKGTDLTLSIKGRECLYITPIPWRGGPGCYPIPLWGEMNWAPLRHETNGVVVIDGITEATTKLKDVDEDVVWHVEDGSIVRVEGGLNAEEFSELFQIDENANVIGELGLGANHRALLATQSEKALLGAVHFGLGENRGYPGGDVRSKVHVDGGVREATVEVDGRLVFQDGRPVL